MVDKISMVKLLLTISLVGLLLLIGCSSGTDSKSTDAIMPSSVKLEANPGYRLSINGTPVRFGLTQINIQDKGILQIHPQPSTTHTYPSDSTVGLLVSAIVKGSKVEWGAVDSQSGDSASVVMRSQRNVVVDIIPPPELQTSKWRVNWFKMREAGVFGSEIGTQELPFNLASDWGTGPVFNYEDRVGFKAVTDIYVHGGTKKRVQFSVESNNGHRLRVNGNLVIDSWDRIVENQGFRSNTQVVSLAPGKHELRLDFYEWDEAASVSISAKPDDISSWCEGAGADASRPVWSNWSAEWLTVNKGADGRIEFGYSLKSVSFPPTFHNDWGRSELIKGEDREVGFRAKNTIRIPGNKPMEIKFTLGSDDGSALWVDGDLLIDNWGLHGYSIKTGIITLDPGAHDLKLDYFEWSADAEIMFESEPKTIFGYCEW